MGHVKVKLCCVMGAQPRAFKGSITGYDAMKVQDFGRIDGELVLFGGVYSNFQALEALISQVGARAAICTGDVVAYCADAAASVSRVRAMNCPVIAGNCERQIADGADDCGCGFGVGSECDLLSRGWYPHALSQIDVDGRAWMAALPDIATFQHSERRYAVIHGGATSHNRFLWPSTDNDDFLFEINILEEMVGAIDGVVAGHSGIAFQRQVERWHWINAGAIGMPPHDGRAETRYAVLKDGEVSFERLSYDVEGAVAAMQSAGLTQGYDRALETGIWPSEDVLPDTLRR